MVIKNVKIFTMDKISNVIENGYVVISDNKIIEISSGSYEGSEENQIDGNKGWLFPGFIDGHTHIGLIEDSISFEGDDINETGDSITPHLRGIDAINPLDRCFTEAREAGVTCLAAGPGSANPIGGQFCVIKTYGNRIDNMIVKAPAAMKFALGENPKSVYHAKNQIPETRMATAAMIRENLIKAKKYAEAIDKANTPAGEDEDQPDEPDFDMKLDSLLPVVKGELSAHFHAHRTDDIFTAIRIAKEFNLKYSIVHCTEGYLIADELLKDNVTVFAGPNLCDRSKPELRSLSFENPGVLSKTGVKLGITTDHPVIPIQYLPLCASLAVKNGMDKMEALKAITINPASILGIDNRVGSIENGKDADLVLFDEDPFGFMAKVVSVWIDGIKIK